MNNGVVEIMMTQFQHVGRTWRVVSINRSCYVRDDRDQDTGPFSGLIEAIQWVKLIRLATTK